jgi:GT2 family glycosyltransferase
VEILVVDNAPRDRRTRDAVESFARDDERIRYACEPRPGLSRARNHGVAVARHDLVAFTDDDVVVDDNWASAILAGFMADPEAACITGIVASSQLDTGPQRYFDARYAWGEAFEPRRYDLGPHRDASRLYPFKAGLFGTGANFAIRRGAVARLGGFDPLLGAGSPCRGGEDLDMFLRIILSGARICFIPAALVWHGNRASIQDLSGQVYSYGLGLGAYLAKHMRDPRLLGALLRETPLQLGEVLQRMRSASGESQLRTESRLLAVSEARGVAAGAALYLRSAWRGHHL